ncbi:hypothetical protein SOASR030_23380 [Leminorella grimontii]|uniref:Curli assembly protein CsgC n=1 Tax=Leminorella grimontii TaxID=82981 RepID=A0AAV5N277_9GAMM|nr:curli assembly chaperone CsgC [Leminorella grimontii]KFC95176.1 putative curli production protein [Leminorella grimontii ATCC 33999 = DSM 5078]GKX56226.1 hypothetical protein SOASR030_23380 [Leminorella grimontii]VFS60936.1 Curli assembly protein CsgC precursor [Leminorella grimontii]
MSLLLVAALSQPLWFNVQQDGANFTVVPMAKLDNACECRLVVEVKRRGAQGESLSVQRQNVSLAAGQEREMGKMTFSASRGDSVQVNVTLSDGASVSFSERWEYPPKI